jgi:hypothetical protein
MDTGREGVFMGYSDTTTSQYKVYAPDLGYVTRTSVVKFNEHQKGGSMNLKLRHGSANPNGSNNPKGSKEIDPNRDTPPWKMSPPLRELPIFSHNASQLDGHEKFLSKLYQSQWEPPRSLNQSPCRIVMPR